MGALFVSEVTNHYSFLIEDSATGCTDEILRISFFHNCLWRLAGMIWAHIAFFHGISGMTVFVDIRMALTELVSKSMKGG